MPLPTPDGGTVGEPVSELMESKSSGMDEGEGSGMTRGVKLSYTRRRNWGRFWGAVFGVSALCSVFRVWCFVRCARRDSERRGSEHETPNTKHRTQSRYTEYHTLRGRTTRTNRPPATPS